MNRPLRTISSRIAIRNRWFYVRIDDVMNAEGQRMTYNVIIGSPSVFVVPVDARGYVYLVKIYRQTIGEFSLEVPAGGCDRDRPERAAKRELREETGLAATKWKLIGINQPSIGVMNKKSHYFLARGISKRYRDQGKEEGIQRVVKIHLHRALSLAGTGRIMDGQTVTALYLSAAELGIIKLNAINTSACV